MSYTKGPWKIHKDSRGRGYEINGDGVEVCRINSRRTGAKRGMPIHFISGKDDDDNARLLAAAPELLEALKKIVSLDNDAHPGLSTWHDFRVKAHKEAEAAIAKAEVAP